MNRQEVSNGLLIRCSVAVNLKTVWGDLRVIEYKFPAPFFSNTKRHERCIGDVLRSRDPQPETHMAAVVDDKERGRSRGCVYLLT